MGIIYHILFFAAINKAAYIFGGLFILQALLFLYFGIIKGVIHFRFRSNIYGYTGLVLMLYALVVYPFLSYRMGHVYPYAPNFGLPCPTVIFTLGTLLWVEKKYSLSILIIPVLWSAIGFTAAVSLGMVEDYGLPVAGIISTIMIISRHHKWNKLAATLAYK